jgi:hypothetical protein
MVTGVGKAGSIKNTHHGQSGRYCTDTTADECPVIIKLSQCPNFLIISGMLIGETRFILKELFKWKYQLLNIVATTYDVMNKYTISNRLIYSLLAG